MAGGVGSRFWPMSTQHKPKQFLDVLGIGKSLLRLTFERLLGVSDSSKIYILTNERYRDLVLSQLPELTSDQVICEPERKKYSAVYCLRSRQDFIYRCKCDFGNFTFRSFNY